MICFCKEDIKHCTYNMVPCIYVYYASAFFKAQMFYSCKCTSLYEGDDGMSENTNSNPAFSIIVILACIGVHWLQYSQLPVTV